MKSVWIVLISAAMLSMAAALATAGTCNTVTTYRAANHGVAYSTVHSYGHHAHVQQVLVPYAVKAVLAPDYYFSTQDYYREQTLADAIAYRVMMMQQKGVMGGNKPATSDVVPGINSQARLPAPAAAPASGSIPDGLQAVVDSKCVRCHSGSDPKRVNLSDLSAVPLATRWECFGRVVAGDMPKGGQRLEDASMKLFGQWTEQPTK